MTPGTQAEAEAYATSMALARCRAVQDRARNQHDTRKAFDMLPALERDYGVVPGETDNVATRQRAVTARKKISNGPRAESIENAIAALLGADFITYRVLTVAEKSVWPTDPALGAGVFGRDEVPTKVFRATTPLSTVSFDCTFSYERVGLDDGVRLAVGDIVCVQAENLAHAEKVTIRAVSGLTAAAVFTRGHDAGSSITTGPFPLSTSTKRHVLVVVSDAAVLDAEKRRKVNDLMARNSRGVTTWAIVKASSPTTIGPLKVGDLVGSKPIGTLTIP